MLSNEMIFLSSSVEPLVDRLASSIADEIAAADSPLHAPSVVVPNRHIERWLRLRLAERDGVSMNLRFPFLATALLEALRDRLPADLATRRPSSRSEVEEAVLATLIAPGGATGPFAAYLDGGGGEGRGRRLWDLASRLADRFLDYAERSSTLLCEWRRDAAEAHATRAESPMEAAERAIFRRIESHLLLPGDLLERAIHSSLPPSHPRPVLHLFLPPVDSSVFSLEIKTMRNLIDLRFFMLEAQPADPVAAEWSSATIEVLRRLRSAGLREERLASGRDGKTALAALQRVLSGASGKGARPRRRSAPSLPPRPAKASPDDATIRIVEAPSRWREVEAAYRYFVRRLDEDRTLRPCEIALLAPEIAEYRPIIEAIFTAGDHRIPVAFLSARSAGESLIGRGLLDLLAAVGGTLRRDEIGRIIRNPCFAAATGLANAEIEEMADWIAELGIHRAADAAQTEALGWRPDETFTWRWGLRRLGLGRVLEAPRPNGSVESLRDWRGLVPRASIRSAGDSLLSDGGAILEALITDLRGIASRRATFADWGEAAARLIERWLDAPEDRPEEAYVRAALLRGLRSGGAFDEAATAIAGAPIPIGLDLARPWIESRLVEIPVESGAPFIAGLAASSIRHLHGLPFRVAWVLGLSEENHPGRNQRDPIDLLSSGAAGAPPIDRNAMDRAAFLDLLLSTRDRLVLSWVGRDLQRDRRHYPSPLITDLRHLAPAAAGRDEALPVAILPLDGGSARHLEAGAAPTPSDAERFPDLFAIPDRVDLALARLRAGLAEAPSQAASSAPVPTACAGDRTISARVLRAYIRNPAEGALRFHLGLGSDDDEDPIGRGEEPFRLDPLSASIFIRAFLDDEIRRIAAGSDETDSPFDKAEMSMAREAAGPPYARLENARLENAGSKGERPRRPPCAYPSGNAPRDRFLARFRHLSLRGEAPTGAFADAEAARLWNNVAPVLDALRRDPRLRAWEFLGDLVAGTPPAEARDPFIIPPLDIGVTAPDGGRVLVEGILPLVFRERDGDGLISIMATNAAAPKKLAEVDRLLDPAFLFLAIQASADPPPALERFRVERLEIIGAYRETTRSARIRSNPAAIAYLRAILTDLVADRGLDLLPFEAAAGLVKTLAKAAAGDEAERAEAEAALLDEIEKDADRVEERYRPLEIARSAIPKNALDLAIRRVLPLAEFIDLTGDEEEDAP
jgi:exodeoxyribonuclease V gamma subunit